MTTRTIRLRSGRWHARVEQDALRGEYLHLTDPTQPDNSMRVHLPFSWRQWDEERLDEVARTPEIRLWCDEHGILWRVAVVGPGTPYPFPLRDRYLVFDSQETWAGITRFDGQHELGELTAEELRELRDRISDFGGSRKEFRPPARPAY